ncbi:MAG: hypothetical protein ABIR96_10745 [Bdellovibrionota bacterium]
MKHAFLISLAFAGCGIDAPVTGVWSRVDGMSPEQWEAGVSTSLSSFAEPSLSKDQENYSQKFSIQGVFGRKFLYLMESDDEVTKATQGTPDGLLKVCPRYSILGDSSKALVWTSIFDAISYSETGYAPSLTYTEKFTDSSGDKVVSTGLFQLSSESAKNHGGACKGATTAKLKDADFNVLCSYQVMTDQILGTDVLFYGNKEFYYWSTLSQGRNAKGFERMMGRLGQLMIDSDRWPQSCGLPAKF